MSPEKEQELVELSRKNRGSFSPLYQYYAPKIYAYVYNRIPRKHIAEDIVSHIFLAAIENLDKYSSQKNARFGSWLYRIAHNKVVDYFRSHPSKVIKSIDDIQAEDPDSRSVDHEIELSFTQKEITKTLFKIKPRYQEILSLKYYGDKTHEEIADIMGVNEKHVAVLLYRAHTAFKKAYPESASFLMDERYTIDHESVKK